MRISPLALALTSSIGLAAEPTCSVVLTDSGTQKINVIKVVRQATGLGLKDSKDLVEAPKPKLVRAGLSRVEADALVVALVASGAKAEVQERGSAAPGHPKNVTTAKRFDVLLQSWGTNKILVIKAVKNATGLGLAETKTLVESAPIVVVKGVEREKAESLVAELSSAGAAASLVSLP